MGKACLLEELDRCIELLKGHQKVSSEEFMRNVVVQDAVCRRFQIAAECCIGLGNHIVAGYGLRRPETNSDIFLILFFLPNEDRKGKMEISKVSKTLEIFFPVSTTKERLSCM